MARAVFFAAAILACSPDRAIGPTVVDTGRVAGTRFVALREVFPPRTVRDEFRVLARAYPGFTGVFFDEDGVFSIVVADTTFPDRWKQHIVLWAARTTGGYVDGNAEPRSVSAKYDYLTLDAAQSAALPILRVVGPWNATWVDEVVGRVVFAFSGPSQVSEARRLLSAEGFDLDLIEVREQAMAATDITLRETRRPVLGGFQISYTNNSEFDCTGGINVFGKDESGSPDYARRYLVTAAHCTPSRTSVDSTVFGQPRLSDPIGFEVDEGMTYSYGWMCTEYRQLPNDVCQTDVAVIQYFDSVSSSWMAVATATAPPLPYTTAPTMTGGVGISNNQLLLFQGMAVRKVGRTTGQTDGKVTQTCVTARFQTFYLTPCVATADYVATGGDSGAPVYIPTSPRRPVGIHFGSLGAVKYLSTMTWIESALGWKYYFY